MKRRGGKPESAAAKKARLAFYAAVLEKGSCRIPLEHECAGVSDPCHILPKSYLKAHCQFNLRMDEPELLAVVWDARNGIPGCRHAHNMMDGPFHDVFFEHLPVEAVEFAIEHDCLWKLEALYPPLEKAA